MESKLQKFLNALEKFRDLDTEIPSQQIVVLLRIRLKPGVTTTELTKVCRLSKAATARHVTALARYGLRGTKGLDFVRLEENPADRREKLLSLTPKGEGFLRTVVELL